MAKRPFPQRALAQPQPGLHRTMPFDVTAAGDNKPWPMAPIPGEFPFKDPPGQAHPPEGEPVPATPGKPPNGISLRSLLIEAAADLRGGIGADPAFHFIETRLAEIATMLPHAVEHSSGDLFRLLRTLNEII